MKIGVLSDTHGYLAPPVFDFFSNCDELWHAGDIGEGEVIERLEAFKPLRAVHGNIDNREIRDRYGKDLVFSCEGVKVYMTHIGGRPPRYNKRVQQLISQHRPDLFVCGHNHILCLKKDPLHQLLYLNPGAAGNYGPQLVGSLVRFEIVSGKIRGVEIMELRREAGIPSPTKLPTIHP